MRLEIELTPDQIHSILAWAYVHPGGDEVLQVPRPGGGVTELHTAEMVNQPSIDSTEARVLIRNVIETVGMLAYTHWENFTGEGAGDTDAASKWASKTMLRMRKL
jgi:hypothetical protein